MICYAYKYFSITLAGGGEDYEAGLGQAQVISPRRIYAAPIFHLINTVLVGPLASTMSPPGDGEQAKTKISSSEK